MRPLRTIQTLLVAIALALPGSVGVAASPKRPSDAERGRELYERMCVSCHGSGARGDGPATVGLVVPVPDLSGKLPETSIEDLIKVVLEGRATMPGYSATIDTYDARRVLRHMSKLAQNPAPPPREAPPADSTEGAPPVVAPPPVKANP
jgi:mono/diheme cytochrome c family protein